VPALIIAGTRDQVVGFQGSAAFNEAIQAAGNATIFELYQGYTHCEFGHLFRTTPAEQQMLTSWLQSLRLKADWPQALPRGIKRKGSG
jgi:hypothetical protein